MTESISGPKSPVEPVNTLRDRARRIGAGVSALSLSLPVAVMARAQTSAQGTGNRHFTAAPGSASGGEESAFDSILGIPVNTIFFAAVVVLGIFWFTLGGGRKAKKLGRQE